MARIDQPVQEKEGSSGEFLRWAKPVDTVPKDESQAKMFEGITESFKGIKELNKFGEESAENRGYDDETKLLNQHISDLESEYSKTFPGTSTASTTGDTLTPDKNATGYDESKVPQPVKDTLSTYANVRAAREQGGLPGHLRDTEFEKQRRLLASRARSDYPTYRQYIDKGFSDADKAPGANEYRKAMLADLNEAYGKKNEAANKVTTQLYENKQFPGVADGPGSILGRHSTGQLDNNGAMYELSKVLATKGQSELAKYQVEMHTANKTFTEDQGRAVMGTYVPTQVTNAINGVIHKYFPDGNVPDNIDPQIARAMAKDFQLAETGVKQNTDTFFAGKTEKNAKGETVVKPGMKDIMGDTYETSFKPYMQPFRTIEQTFTNQEYGHINSVKNALTDNDNSIKSKVFSNTDNISRTYQAIHLNSMLGGQGFQFNLTQMPGFHLPGSNDGEWLKKLFGNAAIPGTKVGGLTTAGDALDTIAKNSGANAGVNAKAHLNDVINGITHDGTPVANKKELVKYLFSKDWSNKIDDDRYDTKTGETTYGKSSVFYKLADPITIKAIDALGDRQLSTQYRSWMHDTFMHDVVPTELNQLANLQKLPGMVLKLHQDPGGGNPMRFEVVPAINREPGNRYGYGVSPNNPATIQYTVAKLNTALEALHNVESKDTANSNFMQILRDHGLNLASQSGTPQNMLNEIILSIGAHQGPKEGSSKDQNRVGPQIPPTQIPAPVKPSVEDIQAAHKADIARELAAKRMRESVKSK